MSRTRTILLEICQRAGLESRLGYDGGQEMFLRSAGNRPCAYIAYTRSARPRAGFDDVAVYFGGADPEASRAKVRGMLERSLEVASVTEGGGEWPSMTVVARAKARILNATAGSGAQPSPAPVPNYFSLTATQVSGGPGVVDFAIYNTAGREVYLEYSLDNGDSWRPFVFTDFDPSYGITVSNVISFYTEGERVLLRGNNRILGNHVSNAIRILGYSGGGTLQLGGDIRTLTDGDNPNGPMKPMAYLFSDYFGFEVHLGGYFNPDASTLTLPEVLTDFCCLGMFRSSDILVPPALPAETLACQCYDEMFADTWFTASDDGETFNFDVGVTFPQTDTCDVYFANAKLLAGHMGLINNGFVF